MSTADFAFDPGLADVFVSEFNSSGDFVLRRVSLGDSGVEDWDLFHEFRVRFHEESFPGDPFTPRDVYEARVRQQLNGPDMSGEIFFVFVRGDVRRVVGVFMLGYPKASSPTFGGNTHLLFVEVMLLREFRRRGIASRLLVFAFRRARELGRRLLYFSCRMRDCVLFLERVGAELSLRSVENRLYLSDVDWGMVEAWVRDGESRNAGFGSSVLVFRRVPDDLLDEFARAYTEVMGEVPTGGIELNTLVYTPEVIRRREAEDAEAGVDRVFLVIVEGDGRVSGLTEVVRVRGLDGVLDQGLTGVGVEFRGRGLGKWLKAAMLLYVREYFPEVEYIRTSNATSNAPMLSINERLGFREFRREVNAQLRVDVLEKYLRERGLL